MTTDKTMRYCAICHCQRPRSKGWMLQLVQGVRVRVCPEHRDKV